MNERHNFGAWANIRLGSQATVRDDHKSVVASSSDDDLQVLHFRKLRYDTNNPELDNLHPAVFASLQNFSRGRNFLSGGAFAHGKVDLEFEDR